MTRRLRPVRRPGSLPENPYRRFFTPMPTFEALARRARERQKRQDADRAVPGGSAKRPAK